MKVLKLMVIAASVAATVPAMAAPEAGGMYAGVVLSKNTAKENAVFLEEKSDQIGVLGGYNITPEISAELSYTTGDVDNSNSTLTNVGFSVGYAYTFPSAPVYVKGKLGVLSQNAKADATNTDPAFKNSSVNPSYGVAVGARSGAFGAELGYTLSEFEDEGDSQDVSLLSLMGVYHF